MNKKLYTLVVSAMVLTLFVSGVSLMVALKDGAEVSVRKAMEEFSRDEALKNASWSFYAIETKSGKELASHNPDLALIPASAQKAVTTITALSLLGKDYRFETLLQYSGTITNGTLDGNLYIKGTGDPTLGSNSLHDSLSLDTLLATWLKELKATGIEKINGDIIADGSWFDDHMIPPKWMWEDMGNYYGAGAHALTVNENMYSVYFEPARQVGAPARVINTKPEIPHMVFKNDVTTGPLRSGDQVYIYGSPYGNERWLTGTVPLGESGFEVKGSIPDPGYFLADTFKQFLQKNNLKISGEPYTHRNAPQSISQTSRVIISRNLSPQLEAITSRTNFNSVNTYAENLIKTLGKTSGENGSFAQGAKVISDFWKEKGIDTQGLRLHDGSGLSPFNNITTRQLTQMLVFATQDDALYESFIKGLPIANRTGSLAGMFASTPSAGNLRAKSGFLGNVRAYTGYTKNRSGNLIAFTIIVNNYSGTPLQMRRKMEVVMDALSRSE